MFSYRPVDSAYVYYGLRSSGATQLLVGRRAADGSWTFGGEERDSVGSVHTRVGISRLPGGRFRFVEQTSRDGVTYGAADTVHYRPARPEPGAP